MSGSTLDLTGEEDPVVGIGHGTGALGPSDSSDSGSDTVGGPGMDEGLSDEMSRQMPMATTKGAGRDLGDANLDSDSDRAGTGERGSSGVDSDIATDQQMSTFVEPGVGSGDELFDDPDVLAVADDGDDDDSADAETDPDADPDDAAVDDGAT